MRFCSGSGGILKGHLSQATALQLWRTLSQLVHQRYVQLALFHQTEDSLLASWQLSTGMREEGKHFKNKGSLLLR